MTARLLRRGLLSLLLLLMGSGVLPSAGVIPGPLATSAGVASSAVQARAAAHPHLSRQVYAYLPYWQLGPQTAGALRYDLLTTIAFFGIPFRSTGDLDTAAPGAAAWLSDNATAVITAAHARGVRVVPTFTLFDGMSARDLTAFLASPAAQRRFIRQAVQLVVQRGADGANVDVEPVPDALAGSFAAFVGRFRAALRARVHDARVVVALGAGADGATIEAIAARADQLFMMAYDYSTGASATAGPVAPLNGRYLSVRNDLARFLRHAAPSKLILGMPVYGYDWPVTTTSAHAAVRTDAAAVGAPFAVTYGAISLFLARHPAVDVQYDRLSQSPFFTYHDHDAGTYRQVWFEDPKSLGRKVDLAQTAGLAGVGLWALDDAPEFAPVWDLLAGKIKSPTHAVTVRGSLFHVAVHGGLVVADVKATVKNVGTVPESGTLGWAVRDGRGRLVASGQVQLTVDWLGFRRPMFAVTLGSAARLPAGTYHLALTYGAGGRHWTAPATTFRQRY